MVASTGNFALTGRDAGTRASRKLPVTVGTFTETGLQLAVLRTAAQRRSCFIYASVQPSLFPIQEEDASWDWRVCAGLAGGWTPLVWQWRLQPHGHNALRCVDRKRCRAKNHPLYDAVPVEFFLTGYDAKYPTASGDWTSSLIARPFGLTFQILQTPGWTCHDC